VLSSPVVSSLAPVFLATIGAARWPAPTTGGRVARQHARHAPLSSPWLSRVE